MNDTDVSRTKQKASSARSHSRSRSYSRSKSQKRITHLLIVSAVLGALLLVALIGWVLTASKLSSTRNELVDMRAASRVLHSNAKLQEQKQVELVGRIEQLEEEMQELVQNRIPQLIPLDLDTTVATGLEYVKNVSFTLTGTLSEKQYEYRAVLRNDSENSIRPNVEIYLFDNLGIQVGKTTLTQDHATSNTDEKSLIPGETRAYSNLVSLERDVEPRYFLIEVE